MLSDLGKPDRARHWGSEPSAIIRGRALPWSVLPSHSRPHTHGSEPWLCIEPTVPWVGG